MFNTVYGRSVIYTFTVLEVAASRWKWCEVDIQ